MCYVPSSTKYTFIYNYCKPFPSTKYMNEYTFVYNTSTITALMAMSNTNCQKVLFILNYNKNPFYIKRSWQGKYNSGHNRIEKINVAPVRYHVDCIVLGHIVLLMVEWIFSSFYIFFYDLLVVGETILFNLFYFFLFRFSH